MSKHYYRMQYLPCGGNQWLPLDPFHQAMHAVSYRCIAMAIKTAGKDGAFLPCFFFHRLYCLSGQYGGANTCLMVASSAIE